MSLLNWLFLGQSLLCPEAADFNADGGPSEDEKGRRKVGWKTT